MCGEAEREQSLSLAHGGCEVLTFDPLLSRVAARRADLRELAVRWATVAADARAEAGGGRGDGVSGLRLVV